MVADGLILRDVGADDRRTVRVSLTAKGQRELRRAREASAAIFARAIDGISADDVALAISVLKRLRRNLESAVTPAPNPSGKETGNVEA
jgi:DNA-binding MarR family transcriptional regulator